jgi:hypothetical protein
MKLIWLVIKKDITRERWALGLWALLFVGQVVLGVVARQSDGADADWVTQVQLGSVGLVWLQVIMGYILVARLVQADAIVGTTVFWLTRPISVARLLAAKALGALLLFGLLPVLLLLPWWLYCQFGWRDVLWTAVDTLGWQLLVISPAFLVASLTDDLGRVLLWTLLLVIGSFSWIVLLTSSLETTLGTRFNSVGATVMFSRVWVAGVVLIVGGIAIAAHQYLTRRIVRSVVLVVLGLGLIAFIGKMWPWNCAKTIGQWHRPAVPTMVTGLERLTLTVEAASSADGAKRETKADRDKDPALIVNVRARGLPDDTKIEAKGVAQVWSWSNDLNLRRVSDFWTENFQELSVLSRAFSLPPPQEDAETLQWEKARREKINARILAEGGQPHRWPSLSATPRIEDRILLRGYVPLPNSFLAKMRTMPPAYRADFYCSLFQSEIVVNLPLKTGARDAGRSRTFRIQEFETDRMAKGGGGSKVTIVTTGPAVARAGLWNSAFMEPALRRSFDPDYFVSVNHTTGDVLWVGPANPGSRSALIGGVNIIWQPLSVRPRQVIRQGQWVELDPQWRDHTTLVFLDTREVARFTREIKTEKFEVRPTNEGKRDVGPTPEKPAGKP